MRKETQNRNEFLDSKLCRVCLKTKFAYLQRAVFAEKVTSLQHNLVKVNRHVQMALSLILRESRSERKRKANSLHAPILSREDWWPGAAAVQLRVWGILNPSH